MAGRFVCVVLCEREKAEINSSDKIDLLDKIIGQVINGTSFC